MTWVAFDGEVQLGSVYRRFKSLVERLASNRLISDLLIQVSLLNLVVVDLHFRNRFERVFGEGGSLARVFQAELDVLDAFDHFVPDYVSVAKDVDVGAQAADLSVKSRCADHLGEVFDEEHVL